MVSRSFHPFRIKKQQKNDAIFPNAHIHPPLTLFTCIYRITFARAKALAAQFNIDKMLHPLFEDDPTAYFCHQDYYGAASNAAVAATQQQQSSLQHPQEECPSWQLGSSSILSEYSAPGTPDIFPPHQQEMMPFSFVSMMNLQEPEDEQLQQQHDFYYYYHNH